MITYAREDSPVLIAVNNREGTPLLTPAWTTRVPGLVVIPNSACQETPESWPCCYSVYAPNWGRRLPLCFPQKICGAAFADMLAHVAPWGSGTIIEICKAVLATGWDTLAPQAVCIGGVSHAEET